MPSGGAARAARAQGAVVNAAGLVQGIALVTFPAASTIFTSPSSYDLSHGQYAAAVDRSVLVLNALLGLGTAVAPVFVAVFNGLGFWIGLPVLTACLLAGLIGVSLRLPLDPGAHRRALPADLPAAAGRAIPAGFWVFAAFAVLYGWCETMNGNWSQLDVTSLGVKPAIASLALTGFWAVVTAGRVLLAAIQRWLPSRAAYHGLPFLLAVAFVLIAALPSHAPAAAVAAFCLAGLGCSALLPLTISFGQRKLADRQAMVAGAVIACYQVGYGLAAFGVGPLTSAGVGLPTVFAASAAVAAVMGGLSLAVAHRQPSPATVHPRPV